MQRTSKRYINVKQPNLVQQGYRYHKLRKIFSKFYPIHYEKVQVGKDQEKVQPSFNELILNFNNELKTLLWPFMITSSINLILRLHYVPGGPGSPV